MVVGASFPKKQSGRQNWWQLWKKYGATTYEAKFWGWRRVPKSIACQKKQKSRQTWEQHRGVLGEFIAGAASETKATFVGNGAL